MKCAVLFWLKCFITLHDSNKASAGITANRKRLMVLSFALTVYLGMDFCSSFNVRNSQHKLQAQFSGKWGSFCNWRLEMNRHLRCWRKSTVFGFFVSGVDLLLKNRRHPYHICVPYQWLRLCQHAWIHLLDMMNLQPLWWKEGCCKCCV